MLKRLKVYFMHSGNLNYNEEIYKKILSSNKCLYHELILPYSENYINKYAKDLINVSDIIIVFIDKPSFLFKFELKWVQTANKPTIYISLKNEIPKSLKKMVPLIQEIDQSNSLIYIIENFIETNANKKDIDNYTPLNLGEISNNEHKSP